MTHTPGRPAQTMRQIREDLGHVQPGEPEAIVSITRYTVSVLNADDINHRYFALSVELTPRGWIVTDGHSGYDADGTAHHGETHWHPFADYDDALAVARRLAPGLTVNGRTALEVYARNPPQHTGGNAEDCPACHGTNPDYPFICPGPQPAV